MQTSEISVKCQLIVMLSQDISHADLIQSCLNSDDEAWREFMRRYDHVISLAVLRTAARWRETSKSVLQDLIQDTYLKLCDQQFKLLRGFEFRGEDSIFCFLKAITANIVHDHFRSIYAKKRGIQLMVDLEELYDSSSSNMPGNPDDMQKNVLRNEVGKVLDELVGPDAERDRNIFWLYYQQGFSANEIAQLPGIGLSAKGVESALNRLARLIKKRLTDKSCGEDG
jgi:RNA polymerase sigma-70 factor (ECF subfamily)